MTPDQFREHADDAYEAIRAMNHSAIDTASIPAPEVYSVLGHLARLGQSLSELTDHLGRCLAGSLDDPAYVVYDRDTDGNDRNPAVQAGYAAAELSAASAAAIEFRKAVAAAQVAINGQGYRPPAVDKDQAYVDQVGEEANYVANQARSWAETNQMIRWMNQAEDGPMPVDELISEYLGQNNPFADDMRVEVRRRDADGWEPAVIVERTGTDEWMVEYDDGEQVWRDHHELRAMNAGEGAR